MSRKTRHVRAPRFKRPRCDKTGHAMYSSRGEALLSSLNLSRRHAVQNTAVYHCTHCRKWHVGLRGG